MASELPILYCEFCNFVQFRSYDDFQVHHLQHIRSCSVVLVRLNDNLTHQLQYRSYEVNRGVARRSANIELVSPLKISFKKKKGVTKFTVVQKQLEEKEDKSVKEEGLKTSNTATSESKSEGGADGQAVEGNKLLERFGANISFTRKSNGSKLKEEPSDDETESKGPPAPVPKPALIKEEKDKLLERLSGFGGISFAPKAKQPANGKQETEVDSKPDAGVLIASKSKSIDISQLRKLQGAEAEPVDKKPFDKNSLLEKLSGFGGISFAAKPKAEEGERKPGAPGPSKEEIAKKALGQLDIEDEDDFDEDEEDEDDEEDDDFTDEEEETKGKKPEVNSAAIPCKSVNDDDDSFETEEQKVNLNLGELDQSDVIKRSTSSPAQEVKRHVRVKNSTVCKTKTELELNRWKNEVEEQTGEKNKTERAIDILERLTDNLNSAVSRDSTEDDCTVVQETLPSLAAHTSKPSMDNLQNLPLSPTPSDQLHPDFIAPVRDNSEQQQTQFAVSTAAEGDSLPRDCSMLITPPDSTQGGDSGGPFSSVSFQSEQFGGPQQNEVEGSVANDMTGSFSDMHGDGQAGGQGLDQANYWQDVNAAPTGLEPPPQDPLMPGEGAAGGEAMSQALRESLLQNFLNDTQSHQNLPPESSEYMSLERLGQGMEQQQGFGEVGAAPMDQLTQQVQRMSNPATQMNVIPHHHLQGPQPPQLHPQHQQPLAGMPLSPQQSQQSQQFDQMNHMQPPAMPPLYQGYIFNQFTQQTPQTGGAPRPPILQQRPQIQPRSFQSMAAPPRPRPRFNVKRNLVRLPSPLELTPPKQRRVESQQQVRSPQQQNTSPAKLPTGLTITPPKKTQEANKVANVLASRGITVTSGGRQGQQAPQGGRGLQRPGGQGQSPVINLGPGVSITPNQRGSGGFAMPSPRRSSPIVNHNVDRPERCTTVDLTLDDDPPPQPRRPGVMGRFQCGQCPKIFTSSVALESHKSSHRAAGTLAHKCDRCTAQYPTAQGLQQHKLSYHKAKQVAPDLAIPIVDLNHPGAKEQLARCGVHSFLPLSQLQSNSNGYFGIPIINLDTAKEKAVSNLNTLGAGNIFVLGKMKTLSPQNR